ncbi:MAG: YpdA family putative bacillithiol disulfide reductase [Calditrichaeota bacterium]|nr:YpdA family putative bacillithiol disulfide reductase [Calditrichota bacterium]
MVYDVIIIGSGPIGLCCGIEARRRGFHHLILEKGCLVNSIFHFPTNMTFFSTAERLEIGEVPFISHREKPTRREALEYYRRVVQHWKLNVHTYEAVEDVLGDFPQFQVVTSRSRYPAKAVVVATGYYDQPNLLNVPGEDLPKVKHYYDEPHPYTFQKIAVIGGGNSAVDVALETFRRGAEVTMVVREPWLKPTIKYWVKPDIENRIKEGSIRAYFNSEVVEIREKELIIRTPDGIRTLENDFVLAMTGYHPNYDFLGKLGITFTDDEIRQPVYNPETMESTRPGIFLAGVVCGGMETNKWTIENARHHAPRIFDYLERIL